MIEVKIVADSLNEFGNRITTMVVTFPRFILAELNTHRMFSRNSASSRAIPFEKMVESVKNNPFVPIAWQKDHKGMQGTDYLDEQRSQFSREIWLSAKDQTVSAANALSLQNATKQLCNRLLEPFMWHTVLITATEWENFFALRCPQYQSYDKMYRSRKDVMKGADISDFEDYSKFSELDWLARNKGQAEIHMMALAEAMWDARNESVPVQLKAGEWHIPFGGTIFHWDTSMNLEINPGYVDSLDTLKVKIATAMCARVSYTVVGEEGKEPNYENDIKLHDRLLQSGHMSPFEHCAQAMNREQYNGSFVSTNFKKSDTSEWDTQDYGWSGNFQGFIQYRKMIPNENRTTNG